ncbi:MULTISPECIES: hypothetical protein [unclassified Crossiella]|uniref:hypothetical protein n=1 Tax=unclassified Crossiella TaxID=2620835 RepID=UPI001FFE85BB|nr:MULTISPECIES: hypothetical protein [unclassified Crossiella]MCK2237702.1 hypothetical protein [Crossiella sp. S99.2]MCK2254988.1 hypothetical protein [Crossiella sp. S99.1]
MGVHKGGVIVVVPEFKWAPRSSIEVRMSAPGKLMSTVTCPWPGGPLGDALWEEYAHWNFPYVRVEFSGEDSHIVSLVT